MGAREGQGREDVAGGPEGLRWRITSELSDKHEKNQKKLAKASDKLFKNFPPGSAPKK